MLPTRQRPELCYRFCQSIEDTAINKDNIIVTVLCDKDDLTYSVLQAKLAEFNFVQYLPQADVSEFPGLTWYWDQIIKQTLESSDIFGMVADDMIFRDYGWDKIILDFFNMLPDKIGLIHFNSASPHGSSICINSFVHKRYIEITGAYNDIRLKGDFSDDFLYYIFSMIDRIAYVPHNVIEHMHYDYGKMEKDETAQRRRAVDDHLYDGMKLIEYYINVSIPLADTFIKKLKSHLLAVDGKNTGLSSLKLNNGLVFKPEKQEKINNYKRKKIRIRYLLRKLLGKKNKSN